MRHQVDNHYQYDNGYGTSKAPQEFVIDGDPTEVWVPITFWVQAHCQACDEERDSQIRQQKLLQSASGPNRDAVRKARTGCNYLSDCGRKGQDTTGQVLINSAGGIFS